MEFESESVYINNKGGVIIPLFEYISVSYVKPLEWAAVVEVCDLEFAEGGVQTDCVFAAGGITIAEKNYVLRPERFKLWSQMS
jgi:hypothetical protein